MVWSRLSKNVCLVVCFFLILCVALTGKANASSYTPYNQGNIGSTQLAIFRDIVGNLPINDSYVAFRSGQYDYKLVAGDLKCDSNSFSGKTQATTVKVYTINTDNNNYNSTYDYIVTTEQNFNLTTGNLLVYSNLGDYPSLEERSVSYAFITMFCVIVIGLCAIIRPLFNFVLRCSRN